MADEYVVVASVLHERTAPYDPDKRTIKKVRVHRRGATVSGLSEADVERHLRSGAIAPKKSDEAKVAEETPTPEPFEPQDPDELLAEPGYGAVAAAAAPPSDVKRPARAASVEAWRKYAVDSTQLSRDEAESLTKDELRERLD